MIEVVPFKEFHVKHLNPVAPAILNIYLTCGEGFTLLVDGVPVAAAGVIMSDGKGSTWGNITNGARALYPKALYKSVTQGLSGIIDRNKLRRVDVIIDPEERANVPWVKRLGFHYEGPMCDFYAVGKHAEYWARTQSKCEVR